MIISIEAEIAFDKNPTRFHDTYIKKKKTQQTRNRREFPPHEKGHP